MKLTDEERNVLLGAIDAIKWYGRCRRVNQDEEGRVCIRGAVVMAATNGREARLSRLSLVNDAEDYHKGLLVNFIPFAMNDDHSSTDEQILWYLANLAGVDPTTVLFDEDDMEVRPECGSVGEIR